MAGFQLIVKDEAIVARLKKLRAATGDLLPVLKPAGERMMMSVQQNFEVGGRPKWKPLSASTIKRKGHSRPLIWHGFLKNVTLKVTKDAAILGAQPNTKDYAARQQFGGTFRHPGGTPYFIDKKTGLAKFISKTSAAGRKLPVTKPHNITTPARPFMVLQDADKTYILDLLDRHVQRAMTS